MTTVPQYFLNRVASSHSARALANIECQKLNWLTWQQIADAVAQRTQALKQVSIEPGDFVAHVGANSVDWILNDLAIQFCGAVHIPFHALSTTRQIATLVEHCRPKAIIVGEPDQLKKIQPALHDDETIVFGNSAVSATEVKSIANWEQPWSGDSQAYLNQQMAESQLDENQLISILYTSGTTGQSKGVMLSQKNVVSNVESKLATLHLDENDIRLCILPMTHIFARVCDIYTWIRSGSRLVISNGREHVMDELQIVRPTYLNAVPYYYEKFWRWLRDTDQLENSDALRSLLGGRIRIANCGGAAIAGRVFDYYWDRNVQLIVGYGLTETSPVITSNRPGAIRRGSVGQVVPAVEIRLADDGEILARGENVMQGYFRDPELTAATISDGWISTGDIGEIDQDGFLFIVGRKKELIVTKGGKNISPVYLESLLNEDLLIAQSMVVGDQQDFLTALIVIDQENMDTHDSNVLDRAAMIQQRVDQCLVDESPTEQIRAIMIADEPFTIDNGLLTAKSSLRRQQIMNRYGERLQQFYEQLRVGNQSS